MIAKIQTTIKNIKDLKNAKYNPRADLTCSDKEYIILKDNIQKFSLLNPIIINKDNTIISGHQRVKVLKDLGYTKVSCIIKDIDKTEEKILNISENKVGGKWDNNKLQDNLIDIDNYGVNMELTGFTETEIENFITLKDIEIEFNDHYENLFTDFKQKCPKCGHEFI